MGYNVESKRPYQSAGAVFRTFEDLDVYQAAREFNVCSDEKYLSEEKIAELQRASWRVLGLINGYLRYLRDRKTADGSTIRENDDFAEGEEGLPNELTI